MSKDDKILAIQSELKAPKNQKNSFGGYKYRSCEDILESVKPLLDKHGLRQTISDEIVNIGDRYYIKATVTVKEDGEVIETAEGYAREAENKKGMDESQITGAASSYARKYALNGLWLIDDTKDADTNEHRRQKEKAKPKNPTLKPDTERWNKAVHHLAGGKVDIDYVKNNYDITDKHLEQLTAESLQVSNDATQ